MVQNVFEVVALTPLSSVTSTIISRHHHQQQQYHHHHGHAHAPVHNQLFASSSFQSIDKDSDNSQHDGDIDNATASSILKKATTATTTTKIPMEMAALQTTNELTIQQQQQQRRQQRRRRQQQRNQQQQQQLPQRMIRVERNIRLPVWPVWAGVIDFFIGWIFGAEVGSKVEQYFLGGRVCPMQFPNDGTTSPFLLLVHHHHNFWKWDFIFRKISALILPEGFPAHAHRGFTTLTYFLPSDEDHSSKDNNSSKSGSGSGGGFIHRDSLGVKQKYGTKGNYLDQAQWLFTGSGMLHEEMFDFEENNQDITDWQYQSRYELYQLWINVPSYHKLDPPKVQLLRTTTSTADNDTDNDNDKNNMNGAATTTDDADYDENDNGSMPTVSTSTTTVSSSPAMMATTTNCDVVVIAGTYAIYDSNSDGSDSDIDVDFVTSQAKPLHSDLSVLHVAITETEATAKAMATSASTTTSTTTGGDTRGWTYHIPNNHETLIVYVRKGSCSMVTKSSRSGSGSDVYDDDTTNNAVDNIYNVDSTSNSESESEKNQSQHQQQQQPTIVPIHSTVFIETPNSDTKSRNNRVHDNDNEDNHWNCDRLIITPLKVNEPVDLLVLSGCPLYADNNKSNVLEPIASQGSMVMNYPSEIETAYRDYQIGKMGIPWDYQLTDEEWKDHLQKTTPTTTTRNRSSVVSSLREEQGGGNE